MANGLNLKMKGMVDEMNNDNMYIICNRDYCMHRGKRGIEIGEEGTCLKFLLPRSPQSNL